MLPRRVSSPQCSPFQQNHFVSSPGFALRVEPAANLCLSPLPRHVNRVIPELSQHDDGKLSTTTALKVANTARSGWIDSFGIETDSTAGNVQAGTSFSGLPELVCIAPRTEQEQQAQEQVFMQLGDEWRQATAEDGAVYYFNRRTRESRWTLPEGIVWLKIISQGGKESGNQGDNEQRSCSISELDTGFHQTTSPLEYRQSRRRSCDASTITEVEGMDEAQGEFEVQTTTKKPTYDGGFLVNPLLSSKEELRPLAHKGLIKDDCRPPGNETFNIQHPISKLNFQPALKESIVNISDRAENAVATTYVNSGSLGNDSSTPREVCQITESDMGQDIYKDGLYDNKTAVSDCAEPPYPQTYERTEIGCFAVNHSLNSSTSIHSHTQGVEPAGDFHSIPYSKSFKIAYSPTSLQRTEMWYYYTISHQERERQLLTLGSMLQQNAKAWLRWEKKLRMTKRNFLSLSFAHTAEYASNLIF